MPLLLEVISGHAGGMGANRSHVVRGETVRIGRDPSCEWVVPDPYISRHHMTVRCLNSMYFVEGKGRTQIALNDRARALRNDEPQPINGGDVLFLDEYEIRVSLIDEAEAAQLQGAALRPEVRVPVNATPSIMSQPGVRDPLDILGAGPAVARPSGSPPPTRSNDILGQAYRPAPVPEQAMPLTIPSPVMRDDWYQSPAPPAAPAEGRLNENWFQASTPPPMTASQPATVSAHAPQPAPMPQATNANGADTLRMILAGAGLDAARLEIPPQTAEKLGAVLRIVVEGTMDVLRARGEIKRQFRLPTTQIARQDNNPLKHSADAADALFNLLVKQNAAYLGVEEAFQDGFEDIRHHQLALLSGLQAGFDSMMTAFDPGRLEDKGGGALRALAGSGRARLWERHVEEYNRLTSDRDDAFRRLFGDAFATAYEAELQRLKNISRNSSSAQRGKR